MDESDRRKSPRSPKKIKTEPDSEKGEVKDSDATKGADQSEMDISKVTEKKDQGKESQVWRAPGGDKKALDLVGTAGKVLLCFFSITALLKHGSYAIYFIHLECTVHRVVQQSPRSI